MGLVFADRAKWDKCQATTKYGLLKNNPHIQDAGQDVTKSNLALNEHPWYRPNKAGFPPLQTLTYEVHRLLSFKFSSWGAFASTKWCNEENKPPASQQTRDILSLEYIHNNVHVSPMQSLPLQHKKNKKYERLTGAPQELGGRHGLSWGP